jgi:transposase
MSTPRRDIRARDTVQWLRDNGRSNPDIERLTGLGHSFVHRWTHRQSPRERGPRGPQPLIDMPGCLQLKNAIVKKRFKSCANSRGLVVNPRTGKFACKDTLQKALKKVGCFSGKMKRTLKELKPHQKLARLQWCQKMLRNPKRLRDWIFSDEKWWCCGTVQGNERMWLEVDDPNPPERFVPKEAHPPKVHVWGAVGWDGLSGLHVFPCNVNQETYRECLELAFLPALGAKGWIEIDKRRQYTFMQDGASSHHAKSVRRFLEERLPTNVRGQKRGEWPPYSADLNPIELLWAILGNRVTRDLPQNREELIKVVVDEWWHLTPETIKKLYDDLKVRCEKCVAAKGGRFEH